MSNLIDRQAAIDAVRHAWAKGLEPTQFLEELPSAQPDAPDTNVGDMISRQAAIDAILAVTGNSSVRELYEHVQEHGLSDMWSGGVNAAIDIIIALPSAQTVIRCKDCKYYREYGYVNGKPKFLPKCGFNSIYVNADDFCSRAERRADG